MTVGAQTGFSRVNLIEGRARPGNTPAFHSCMRGGTIEKNFGDVTKVECPDPDGFDSFIEIGQLKGQDERPTSSLVGRFFADAESVMGRIAKNGCAFDAHINFGRCTDPRINNSFTKKIIFEGVQITTYSTEDLGALSSDERAQINETVEFSAISWYEVLRLGFTEKAGTEVTNEVVDVVICDTVACGECTDVSSGCEKIYAITLAAGGSPGTPPDIIFSLDKGVNWIAHDIDTMSSSEDPSAIECVGNYVVVVSNETNSLHYVLKADLKASFDPTFTEVTTGFVAGGEPNDIVTVGNQVWICGDGGYVYTSTDVTASVTVLDPGGSVTDNLNAITALNENFIVAVGDSGAMILSENGSTFAEVTPRFVGAGIDLNAVLLIDENVWFAGTSDGRLFYTLDKGATWTERTFSGSGAGVVRALAKSIDSVLYMAHDTAANVGRIFRSYDGGNSWVIMSEATASIPANDRVNALAACPDDINFIVGVGLADNASDGYIVIGED